MARVSPKSCKASRPDSAQQEDGDDEQAQGAHGAMLLRGSWVVGRGSWGVGGRRDRGPWEGAVAIAADGLADHVRHHLEEQRVNILPYERSSNDKHLVMAVVARPRSRTYRRFGIFSLKEAFCIL